MSDTKIKFLNLSADRIFHTLEGEGEFVGQPSVFLRTSGCNLRCAGFISEDAPYGCDSYISWSKNNKLTHSQVFDLLESPVSSTDSSSFIDKLYNGAILKLTGGEPLLRQRELLDFCDEFKIKYNFIPRIDFETNATLLPEERWVNEFQATFTTSPKLRSNGDPKHKRYVEHVLDWHAMHNSGFKFVVQGRHDMKEIMSEYVDKFDIPSGRVWLMPCAGSRQEHINVAKEVAELAKEYHFNFSPRLHLLLWDKALGV